MSDNSAHVTALTVPTIKFAYDDGLAFLANTRSSFQGSDYPASAFYAMAQWPNQPDWNSVDEYRTAMLSDAQQQQPSTTQQTAPACPPGFTPGKVGDVPTCERDSGFYPGELKDSVTNALKDSFGFLTNDLPKRLGFVLLAVVLVYIGVNALTNGAPNRAIASAAAA